VLLTSRREADLINELKDAFSLHMGVEEVKNDIRAFTEHRISSSPMLSDAHVRHRILTMLNARNKGMFLWVAMVLKELETTVSVYEIEATILSMPEDLEGVYKRILERLSRTLKRSQKKLCCKIVRLLAVAKRAFLLEELNEALKLEFSDDGGHAISLGLLYSHTDLERFCGSLATVRNRSIRLIHASTHEYLLKPPGQLQLKSELWDFFGDVGEENARIAELCTRYISTHCVTLNGKYRQREGESKGRLAKELIKDLPFIEYACFTWLVHL
jgi:hypothetical protein